MIATRPAPATEKKDTGALLIIPKKKIDTGKGKEKDPHIEIERQRATLAHRDGTTVAPTITMQVVARQVVQGGILCPRP